MSAQPVEARDAEIVRSAREGETYTSIARRIGLSRERVGEIARAAGMPNRRHGRHHHRWNGGRWQDSLGYIRVLAPRHPRAHRRYVHEHVLIAERALGKPLPEAAEVHHVNGDPSDNRPQNLVICQDRAYHMLLHQRQRALEACGRPDWLPCPHCGEHSDPQDPGFYVRPGGTHGFHRACARAYKDELRLRGGGR